MKEQIIQEATATVPPVLVEKTRGPLVESQYRGVVCVVDERGEVIFSLGDAEMLCYPRSALKLLQVLPLIESGAADLFGFNAEELTVMCGSHNGEDAHVAAIQSILRKIGLAEEHLRCGPQYPTFRELRYQMIREERPPQHIHNNCSGKHAGFLALSVYRGVSPEGYLDPQHPVQQEVRQVIAEMSEMEGSRFITAVDGCSAPIYAMPIRNHAISYKNLVAPMHFSAERQAACQRVVEAVAAHPHMVAGTKRYCTDLLQHLGHRVIGKTGADGVYSLSFREEKLGVVIKIEDGQMGPQNNVAQALLEESGLFSEKQLQPLRQYLRQPVRNWNKWEVGEMRVREGLLKDWLGHGREI